MPGIRTAAHDSFVRKTRRFFVYLMASHSRVVYIGMTSNLMRRVWEHRTGVLQGFTQRYRVYRLVHFEEYADARLATARERQLQGWSRDRKVSLVESCNPGWIDLASTWFE